ncbi:hypothetical protein Slin15195_G107280 [Septoria linicola]|uniref:Uncharacterized protein n=1 Tax=Septoria linicola TaxID=215465 RepID=A0A9Q9AXV9_9PEZI|nr:hypothetical protein Slin14017_G070230 [Septoria linicola]USW57409.1 hypothetical protein Slin15195_G107280 [Septoria linicola]
MASVRRYTREELIALSRSKLVSRPDNLPAIEQWIEYVYLEQEDGKREKLRIAHSEPPPASSDHERHKSNDGTLGKGKQPRAGLAGAAAAEGSPMGAFSTGRPTLTSRSSTLRNASGEDVSLGPPRNMFPSTRNVTKSSDFHDKNGSSDATPNDEPDSMRSRFFSDRQLNRRSGAEKEASDGKDRWTSVRERRQQGELDDEKRGFGSRHDKDNEGDRRNGYGHKDDPRWSREDRPNGTRTGGGWREREAARRDRDHHEREPEWMDDPVVKKDQQLGLTARTQDDFEEWKRQMAGKPKVEKEEAPIPEPVALPAATEQPKATLKLDGFENGFFGFGGGSAVATPGASTPSAVATSTATKTSGKSGKTSRFASMFKPVEPEPTPAPAAAEEPQPQAANGAASKSVEDQEGFNRVLAMLGGTKINQAPAAPEPARELAPSYAEPVPTSPPPPPKSMTSSGTLPGGRKSRFTDIFAQEKNPERLQSPQQNSPPFGADSGFEGSHRGLPDDPTQLFANNRQPERQPIQQQLPRTQAPETTMSPVPSGIPFNALREQQPRPSSGRLNEAYNRFEPPSRGAASPDRNIQDLLAQPRQHSQATPAQSQDLLNLLRNPKSSRPPSQQAIPASGGIDQVELERWLQQQQPMQTHGPTQTIAPKPRGPQQPPGLFEEQLMRNYGHEQQRHEQVPQLQERQQPRGPPGFYNPEQEALFAQQQRHAHQQAQQQAEREAQHAQLRRQQQYAELSQQQQMQQQQQQQPPRRMSGHPALQQMHIPQQHSQPGFHQLTSPVGGGAPPPGFNQMPRYPPGFANVNTFQQPRDQAPPGFSNGPMSPPAGLAGGAPPGFFGGPPNLPPGFHAQQIRSPPAEVPGRRPPYEEYGRR